MLTFGIVLLVFAAILKIVSIVNYCRGSGPIIDPFALGSLLILVAAILISSHFRDVNDTTLVVDEQEAVWIENR